MSSSYVPPEYESVDNMIEAMLLVRDWRSALSKRSRRLEQNTALKDQERDARIEVIRKAETKILRMIKKGQLIESGPCGNKGPAILRSNLNNCTAKVKTEPSLALSANAQKKRSKTAVTVKEEVEPTHVLGVKRTRRSSSGSASLPPAPMHTNRRRMSSDIPEAPNFARQAPKTDDLQNALRRRGLRILRLQDELAQLKKEHEIKMQLLEKRQRLD